MVGDVKGISATKRCVSGCSAVRCVVVSDVAGSMLVLRPAKVGTPLPPKTIEKAQIVHLDFSGCHQIDIFVRVIKREFSYLKILS